MPPPLADPRGCLGFAETLDFPCSCCGSAGYKIIGCVGDRQLGTTERKFELRECMGCGAIVLSPPPNEAELADYYPRGYWWQTATPSSWHKWLETFRQLTVRGHVRKVKALAVASAGAQRRLLDIGCGDGSFLAACRALPLVRFGLDMSWDALRAAKERGGFGVLQGSIEALPFPDNSFAVITLLHVLEHLSYPVSCLREVHRLLEPRGWLIIQVPNTASLERHLFGQTWAGFEVPRHLINYSDRCLGALLERYGFIIARIDHFSWRDNPSVLVRSLFPRLYPPSRRLACRHSHHSRWLDGILDLLYLFLVLIATPFAWAESLAGRGGIIFVEARKGSSPLSYEGAAVGSPE
jgi:SAM-dependent methyltransferase